MKRRCYQKQIKNYHIYGGRGITVCQEWLESTDAFLKWAIEANYRPWLSIDRINNEGPYSPENCQWANRTQQALNRRTASMVTAFGETKNLSLWAQDERCCVSADTIRVRMAIGTDAETAITTPSRKLIKRPKRTSPISSHETIREIHALIASGVKQVELAKKYNVANSFISGIALGKRWSSLGLKPIITRKKRSDSRK